MGKAVLIIKNSAEGPGLLQELLDEQRIPYKTVELAKGEEFPEPLGYAALVVLGGPDSANDQTLKMYTELARINEALAAGLPYLGICLGLQTLVKAAGGDVFKNAVKEIGLRDPDGGFFQVELTDEGKCDPLFAGLGDEFPVFQLHGETVELTPGMTLLGKSKFCPDQVVKIGQKAYGIQCHFELTPELFRAWCQTDAELQLLDQAALARDFALIETEYLRTGRRLFSNFLKIAGFLS